MPVLDLAAVRAGSCGTSPAHCTTCEPKPATIQNTRRSCSPLVRPHKAAPSQLDAPQIPLSCCFGLVRSPGREASENPWITAGNAARSLTPST
jgi:hypothetical protein